MILSRDAEIGLSLYFLGTRSADIFTPAFGAAHGREWNENLVVGRGMGGTRYGFTWASKPNDHIIMGGEGKLCYYKSYALRGYETGIPYTIGNNLVGIFFITNVLSFSMEHGYQYGGRSCSVMGCLLCERVLAVWRMLYM